MKIVTAGKRGFRTLNAEVREVLETENEVRIEDVNGQRYIGAGLDRGKRLEVHGTPGNDMGAYLNGGTIEVFGNGQEAVGNTMGGGSVTVHGHVGDTLGYAMRDGEIYVEKRAGSRAGIHMKEFREMQPVVVIGGTVGAFLGEYMAGGTLVVLGLDRCGHAPDRRRALCHGHARRPQFSCAAKSRRRISANTLPCLRPMKRILRTWTASCANTAARASAGTRRKF